MLSISTARSSSKVINKIIVTYGTQSITFDGKMQIKLEKPTSNIEEEANLFDCFNDYVSSVISDDDQKKLFEELDKTILNDSDEFKNIKKYL